MPKECQASPFDSLGDGSLFRDAVQFFVADHFGILDVKCNPEESPMKTVEAVL